MLHDRNGEVLLLGDVVFIPCIVIKVEETAPEFYNVTLETIEPMFPGEHKTPIILNAKQIEKPKAVMLSPSISIMETKDDRH